MSILVELKALLRLRLVQLFALALMLTGLATLGIVSKSPVRDADVWWHLRVGDWMFQNHAFPHVGLFSRTAATHPWVAYSWGYELLLSRAYAWFGLIGLASFGILLIVAVAWVFFWMLYRLSGRFWLSWVLCTVGSLSFLFNLLPRPVFFSMMLFMATLTFILEAHRSGSARPLYGLPLIFVIWANLHIQFVYGLFVVGLFVGINLFLRACKSASIWPRLLPCPSFRPRVLMAIFAGCILACCVGPYSYHLFEVVFEYSKSQVPYLYSQELQPLDFKHPSDYCLVLLAVAAFFAIGWRKKIDLFKLVLLTVASALAFRTLRDAWFLAVCAGAFIADSLPVECDRRNRMRLHELASVGAVLAVILFLIAGNTDFNTRELDRAISRDFPVDAVNFLRRNPVPGPLYNDFGWGGFLIWYMPEYPVAIDGRNDLYGDAVDFVTYNSMAGDYAADPYLKEAGLVLIPRETPLASKLRGDPQFRVVFEDPLSIVFARN